ncbi:MAG: hypothetical protein ACLSIR_08195 [Christensenellales bacterium]
MTTRWFWPRPWGGAAAGGGSGRVRAAQRRNDGHRAGRGCGVNVTGCDGSGRLRRCAPGDCRAAGWGMARGTRRASARFTTGARGAAQTRRGAYDLGFEALRIE